MGRWSVFNGPAQRANGAGRPSAIHWRAVSLELGPGAVTFARGVTMSKNPETFETFEQFWPHFLSSHRKASTRWAHVAAVGAGIAGAALALRRHSALPMLAGLGAAAALAGGAHPVFEGNTPENGGHPLWAARAIARMCLRTITGAIHADIEKIAGP
jgi:hypothetical protein